MLPRPRSVLDDPTLFENRLPVPHGHGNNSARYHKRSVREGFEKQKRLEEIEAALRERKMIEAIAWEIDNFPDHFRDVTSVRDLLDVKAPSIEVVD